jgi:two-component system chemotaxis sensor kinase CheA
MNTVNQQNRFSGELDLVHDFITESREHLLAAETAILDLEAEPDNKELINRIFRAFHTIKGLAGFLNFAEIGRFAHITENLLDAARNCEFTISSVHSDLIFESIDCLNKAISYIEAAIVSNSEYQIPAEMEGIYERISSVMDMKKCDKRKIGEILVDEGKATEEQVQNALEQQKNGDSRRTGEFLVEKKDVSPQVINSVLRQQFETKNAESDGLIKVLVSKLDLLIDTVGEAVIAQSMLSADPSIKALRSSLFRMKMARMSLIMRQVQELSMSLRMVTVKPAFQKIARLVRDLSKKTGKDIELITEGEDTELDKSIVEKVADPLVHMVRNSIDHGIETAEERKAKGKSLKANVILRAYHKGGNIAIEVEDDGKGLDKEKILLKALENRLCKSPEYLTDQEIYQFIFLPGFSTSAAVTDISGRGVGMDVVRQNIETLRGVIDIHSEKDKGTRFTLRFPLTLAIIDGMVVKSHGEIFIMPTASVVESVAVSEENISTILGKSILKLREEIIPLCRLVDALSGNRNYSACVKLAVIVEDATGKKIALGVDEILGQQQVVIKSIANFLEKITGISGSAIMSDGSVSLIVDISAIRRNLNI